MLSVGDYVVPAIDSLHYRAAISGSSKMDSVPPSAITSICFRIALRVNTTWPRSNLYGVVNEDRRLDILAPNRKFFTVVFRTSYNIVNFDDGSFFLSRDRRDHSRRMGEFRFDHLSPTYMIS